MTLPEPVSGPVVLEVVADDVTRAAAYALRHEVFVTEQGVPVELELDTNDAAALHVVARWYPVAGSEPVDSDVVGTGRMVTEAPGFEGLPGDAGPVAHLGRIAVRRSARRQGVGAAIVQELTRQARASGLRVAYLGAQTHAVPFYERLGWAAFGAEFDDAGLPHRHMRRSL